MKRIFTLTDDGVDIVAVIDEHIHNERAKPSTNAAIKTVHHFSEVPACIVLYAIGIADEKDLANMVQHGYAEWHVIDDRTD